jgi:hypothetical protein
MEGAVPPHATRPNRRPHPVSRKRAGSANVPSTCLSRGPRGEPRGQETQHPAASCIFVAEARATKAHRRMTL